MCNGNRLKRHYIFIFHVQEAVDNVLKSGKSELEALLKNREA